MCVDLCLSVCRLTLARKKYFGSERERDVSTFRLLTILDTKHLMRYDDA